jgi:hypothetical protein
MSVAAAAGLFLLAILGSADPVDRSHRVEDSTGTPRLYGDSFDWQTNGPQEFLKVLRDRDSFYTVDGVHVGWIREADVPGLIALLESREPVAHVVMVISSYLPRARSFVGQEALFLVEGFRQGRYPPSTHSGGRFVERKQEILGWWAKRSNTPKSRQQPGNNGMNLTKGAQEARAARAQLH